MTKPPSKTGAGKAPPKPQPKSKPHPRPAATKAQQAAFKRMDKHVSKPMPKKH